MGTGLTPLGEQQVNFLINSTDGLTGAQADPAVTALSNGDFVVVYENPSNGTTNIDLFAHFFDANGNAIAPPATTTLSNGVVGIDQGIAVTDHPALAATANGGFAVIYTDATNKDINVRTYSATSGISSPFTVASPGGNPNIHGIDSAAIATFADGSMLVSLEVIFSATDHDVWDGILNSTATGFVVSVNSVTSDNAFEGESRVATFGNTAALVYARDPGTLGGGQDIVLNFLNSVGTALASPTFVFGTSSSDVWSHPDVAALGDGRFIVVAQDDTTGSITAAIVDPPTHTVTKVLTEGGFGSVFTNPHVAGVTADGFIVTFEFGGDVFAVREVAAGASFFTAEGAVESFTAGSQDENAVAVNGAETAFFAWQDTGSGDPSATDTDTRIAAQAFHLQRIPAFDDFVGIGSSDIPWLSTSTGDLDEWKIYNGQWANSIDFGAHPGNYTLAGTGDFNRDGTSDYLWYSQSTGQTDIWLTDDIGEWKASVSPGNHPTGYQVAGTGDFNNDGTSDVLFFNPTNGDVDEWKLSNGGWAGSVDLGSHPGGYQISGIGDYNGDGTSDVFWYNQSTGQTDIWELKNGQWMASVSPGNHPTGYQVAGIGDFNGDGTSDILFYNPTNGDVDEWQLSNGRWAASVDLGTHPGGSAWQISGTGDYNGDGISDVLWSDSATGQTDIWELSNTGHWAASTSPGSHPTGYQVQFPNVS